METAAHVPTTQGRSHVSDTNEENGQNFLRYQGYCPVLIYSKSQTVNHAYHLEILKRLRELCIEKDPELRPNDWILHHDKAPAHKTLSVKEFLARKSIIEIEHPLSSPDLALNDFWLAAFQERRFRDIEDIKKKKKKKKVRRH
jgi:hypothetical protein